jgi:hypothetical protein
MRRRRSACGRSPERRCLFRTVARHAARRVAARVRKPLPALTPLTQGRGRSRRSRSRRASTAPVRAHSEGLVCLSGCARDGLAVRNGTGPAELASVFGRDRFFVELQRPYERGRRAAERAAAAARGDDRRADGRHRERPRAQPQARAAPGRDGRDPAHGRRSRAPSASGEGTTSASCSLPTRSPSASRTISTPSHAPPSSRSASSSTSPTSSATATRTSPTATSPRSPS